LSVARPLSEGDLIDLDWISRVLDSFGTIQAIFFVVLSSEFDLSGKRGLVLAPGCCGGCGGGCFGGRGCDLE